MSDLIREALENLVRQQDGHPRSLEKLRRQGLSPDHPTVTATMEGHRLMMDRAWQQAREAISRTPYPSTRQQEVGSGAARDVLAERARQISAEGWTPEHDDEHAGGQMADAAAAYALEAAQQVGGMMPSAPNDVPPGWWPWDWKWWKPKDARSNLVRAGALILAEIERLDRAAAPSTPEKAGGVTAGVPASDDCSSCGGSGSQGQTGCTDCLGTGVDPMSDRALGVGGNDAA